MAISAPAMLHRNTAVLALKACTPKWRDRVVNHKSGTTANGNCKPRITWLRTRSLPTPAFPNIRVMVGDDAGAAAAYR